jgi:predicted DNA-binding transcriptional regulator AlpA
MPAVGAKPLPSDLIRVGEVARLLGVSRQRAHQLASEESFPTPVARDRRGRLWSREVVEDWGAHGGVVRGEALARSVISAALRPVLTS